MSVDKTAEEDRPREFLEVDTGGRSAGTVYDHCCETMDSVEWLGLSHLRRNQVSVRSVVQTGGHLVANMSAFYFCGRPNVEMCILACLLIVECSCVSLGLLKTVDCGVLPVTFTRLTSFQKERVLALDLQRKQTLLLL